MLKNAHFMLEFIYRIVVSDGIFLKRYYYRNTKLSRLKEVKEYDNY